MSMDLTPQIKDRISTLQNCIRKAGKEFNVDVILIASVCWQESGFDPFAVRFEPSFFRKYVDTMLREKIIKQNPYVKTGIPTEATERQLLAMSFGPMQIMGQTARERDCKEQFLTSLCSERGVYWGTKNLRHLFNLYHLSAEVISAYNAGSPIASNKDNYVQPVLSRYEILSMDEDVERMLKPEGERT